MMIPPYFTEITLTDFIREREEEEGRKLVTCVYSKELKTS